MQWDLPLIWAGLIGTAVAMYVILDGFDLGIAILFPFHPDENDRDRIVDTIAPFWDGNETWLVLGGVGLLVAFPMAYAVIMPAFYVPVIVMLLALVFRGVSFEFRTIAVTSKPMWNVAFWLGSLIAGFSQGMILGGLIQGVDVADNKFAGGPFDFATPFAAVCGVGVVLGYGLLGATWLIMKTDEGIAERARIQAKVLLIAVLGFMAIVSAWTPLQFERISERWFSLPNILYLWPIPIVTGLVALACWWGLVRGHDRLPFFSAIGLFLLGYLGLIISVFPYLVPPSLTIWETAAARESQMFILIGTLPLLPIILGYTVFVYWVFRGKVREGEGYH